MTEKSRSAEELTSEELDAQAGEELPAREAMSILPIEPTGIPIPIEDDYTRPDPGPVERDPTV